jgi:hypothetical protein
MILENQSSYPSAENLRKAVLREYDFYSDRRRVGPCGAVAVALSRLGFGKVARIYAISDEDRPDCVNCAFPHYVVVTPEEKILDVSLPSDFRCVGYEEPPDLCGDDVHQDDAFLWDEEDYSFWLGIFVPIIWHETAHSPTLSSRSDEDVWGSV